jgi:hypothetical protein
MPGLYGPIGFMFAGEIGLGAPAREKAMAQVRNTKGVSRIRN